MVVRLSAQHVYALAQGKLVANFQKLCTRAHHFVCQGVTNAIFGYKYIMSHFLNSRSIVQRVLRVLGIEKTKKSFLLWEGGRAVWIEVDLIEFFIESSTKVGSSSKLMSVWFVLMFSPCFRSQSWLWLRIYWSMVVERFLSRLLWSGFNQDCLGVIFTRLYLWKGLSIEIKY